VFLPACASNSSSTGGGCTAVPSVPGGLAASSTTSTGTTLNWSASTVGSSCTLTGYAIYQNGTQIGTSTTPTFNVTGLTAGTTYSFTVAASDGAGMSGQSTPVSVTTTGGTFTVTITGTDTSNLVHSTQVTLTVN
jgi:chitodextrinase